MKGASGQTILGVIVILIGALLLVETTGIADTGMLWQFIPSIFILLGLWRLVSSGFQSVVGPVVLIFIASFVQLAVLGYDPGEYWPIILIALGLAMLFGGSRIRRATSGAFRGSHTGADDRRVNATAILGSSEPRITSQDFQGGQAVAVMGGVVVDLREASIIDKPAAIDVTAIMGGVEIRVPAHWKVNRDVLAVMGGTSDSRKRYDMPPPDTTDPISDVPDLVITGLALMGGVEVKG